MNKEAWIARSAIALLVLVLFGWMAWIAWRAVKAPEYDYNIYTESGAEFLGVDSYTTIDAGIRIEFNGTTVIIMESVRIEKYEEEANEE